MSTSDRRTSEATPPPPAGACAALHWAADAYERDIRASRPELAPTDPLPGPHRGFVWWLRTTAGRIATEPGS